MKEILTLIENVDPADTKTLDEIDTLVTEYAAKPKDCYDHNGNPCTWEKQKAYLIKHKIKPSYPFTRSRDALKSIRPEGWVFSVVSNGVCAAYPGHDQPGVVTISSPVIIKAVEKTEELAELHCVIQAIAYERGK